mgnify:CR=1 FL=1
MWILLWIVQALFGALWMTLSKLVLENKVVWNNLQTFFSRGVALLILWILFIFGIFNFNFTTQSLSIIEWCLFLLSACALYYTYYLRRTAYANEKVSVLQPFAMLFQIFPIIFWFAFIASERVNIVTFVMALIASFIVIGTSVDFKRFKINKYSAMVLLSSVIKSVQVFFILHLLTKLNPATLYFVETIVILIFAWLLLVTKSEFHQFKLLTKKYSKLLVLTNIIGLTSIILIFTLYTWLWLVATSLLSLLYLWFVYLFWFFILWDKPGNRDIIVTLLVSICIIVWMIFKT